MSIKKNFAYSSILTTSSYIFPLLTFPYVNRVLGVNNIGICSFVEGVVGYFMLFSAMGIGTLAIREVAKYKSDKLSLSKAFSSLLSLNMLTTFIAMVILFVSILIIPEFERHEGMFYIAIGQILFKTLLIEWLFIGLEDFKYITIRTILIKVIYVLFVFIFINTPDDYQKYFALNVLAVVVNAIVNMLYSRHFVAYTLKGIRIKQYIEPFIVLGIYGILTSLYKSFNIVFLGFSSNDVQVGYYSTATRVYSIILSLFTAFTGVMLPRMSSLVAEGKSAEFLSLANKSVDALLFFTIPLIVISEFFAPNIIYLLAGTGYEGAVLPMRIVMPLMLVIGYEQIIIIQMLMPLKKDRAILINSFWGGICALILNFVLVPRLESIGSAIVWVCSELLVLLSAQYFIYKYVKFDFPFSKMISRTFFSLPLIIVYFFLNEYWNEKSILCPIFISCVISLYFYLLEIKIFKNEIVISNSLKIANVCKNVFR